MPKLKAGTVVPTAEEDRAIRAGVAADPECRELDGEWFKGARPAAEAMPSETYAALVRRPRGRPKADTTKVFTAIRIDADILAAFKSTGKGWQTRVNAALRQFVREHPAG
ncbi:MAG: BrnA antitoxin family protein [Acidobacteriota bacterium]|jgi:uncharacterized protein (DUF4415 family)|nr:BrnA antitoxin family protein [Acidobacteriota bacterium]